MTEPDGPEDNTADEELAAAAGGDASDRPFITGEPSGLRMESDS